MPMKSIVELYQYVGRKGTLSISNGWQVPIECVNVRQVAYGHTDYQVRPIDAEGKPIWVRVGLTWDEDGKCSE